jgi:hypothetical protein
MPKTIDAAISRIEEAYRRDEAAGVASGATSLDLLQAIYRNDTIPLSVRMRAAIEALPFEHPKLSATAIIPGGGDFEARLKRAIARSREQKLIEHIPEATPSADHRLDSDCA